MQSDAKLEAYRAASVALDEYFCGYDKGRAKTDPVYQYVVEGRDVPSSYEHYSSCADRAHAKLWRLGCRSSFVNREERSPDPNDWRSGVNIARLHDLKRGAPCLYKVTDTGARYAVPPGAGWTPEPGDELIIWNSGPDAHSLSILSFDGTIARTANYGASGMSKREFPGARIAEDRLVFDGNFWRYGEGLKRKVVQRVLRLVDIIPTLTAPPDLTYLDGDVLPGMSEALDVIAS